MTRMSVDLTGLDALFKQVRGLEENADDALTGVVTDLVVDTQAFAVRGLHEGGTGRVYQKYQPRRTHQASAPGQYPASDTGRLASSVQINLPTAANITGEVGTNIAYGPMLELGTSRMAARPWLLPSFERARIGVERDLKARFESRL